MMTNCPNCGAPIVAAKCDYCGTIFTSLSSPSINIKPDVEVITYLKLKNQLLQRQVSLNHLYTEAIMAMRNYGKGE